MELKSVEQVVKAVGGTTEAAAMVGIGKSAVSHWKDRGRIPAKFFSVFSDKLTRDGLQACPEVFGMGRFVERAAK